MLFAVLGIVAGCSGAASRAEPLAPLQVRREPVLAPGTASGFIKPIRSISLPGTSMGPNTLDVDSSGTVYALMAHPSFAQLFVAAASSTTATQILQSFPIRPFAVDDSGDIFAATVSGSPIHSDVALLEFAPGATSPERAIKGPNTQLFSPPVPDAVGVPRQR